MHSKSPKWELGFVHYIMKFTILRFVISRFECIYSHKEDMLADPQSLHAIQGIYRMVTDYIGMKNMPLNFDEFADIYGKMAINGFEICDEMGQNRYVCNL